MYIPERGDIFYLEFDHEYHYAFLLHFLHSTLSIKFCHKLGN